MAPVPQNSKAIRGFSWAVRGAGLCPQRSTLQGWQLQSLPRKGVCSVETILSSNGSSCQRTFHGVHHKSQFCVLQGKHRMSFFPRCSMCKHVGARWRFWS